MARNLWRILIYIKNASGSAPHGPLGPQRSHGASTAPAGHIAGWPHSSYRSRSVALMAVERRGHCKALDHRARNRDVRSFFRRQAHVSRLASQGSRLNARVSRLASIAHSAAITQATVHHLVTSGLIERRGAASGGLRGGLTPHSAHPGAHVNGRAQGFAVHAARGLDRWP